MPTNHRTMGESTGMWVGPELEHTQFHGLKTIFFSRFSALEKNQHLALSQQDLENTYEHVFIAEINPKFWEGVDWHTPPRPHLRFLALIENILKHGQRVTVEIAYESQNIISSSYYLDLRKKYPHTFCLFLVLELDEPDLGGYAVKVAPPVVFEDRENEKGVMVCTCNQFELGRTNWNEYTVDQDL